MRFDRLHRLYDFMTETPLPIERKWDFGDINTGGQANGWSCGSAGCAMGEFPLIWPREWEFTACSVFLKNKNGCGAFGDAAEFFGLTHGEANHLFDPDSQTKRHDPKCSFLTRKSTRREVARNLKSFIIHQLKLESKGLK